MLRNRSIPISTALMGDHISGQSSPSKNETSIFGFSRFKAFAINRHTAEPCSPMSPTSTIDGAKLFSTLKNPFPSDSGHQARHRDTTKKKQSWKNKESKGIGVALVSPLPCANQVEEDGTGMVFFGAKVRVQIPPQSSSAHSSTESPLSPSDFGIKTRRPWSPASRSPQDFPGDYATYLSQREMELSEDYTCVISHGPNPKTTHIFGNRIVENFASSSSPMNTISSVRSPESFLSHCYTCNKNLDEKFDIFIYGGDKGFCSPECRWQKMLENDDDHER